jgi:hypothetical protein
MSVAQDRFAVLHRTNVAGAVPRVVLVQSLGALRIWLSTMGLSRDTLAASLKEKP